MESRFARVVIRIGSVFALLFLYVPLAIVFVYAFNSRIGQKWPIDSFTTKYWTLAFHNSDLAEALRNSLIIASAATVVALLLGSLAAFLLNDSGVVAGGLMLAFVAVGAGMLAVPVTGDR